MIRPSRSLKSKADWPHSAPRTAITKRWNQDPSPIVCLKICAWRLVAQAADCRLMRDRRQMVRKPPLASSGHEGQPGNLMRHCSKLPNSATQQSAKDATRRADPACLNSRPLIGSRPTAVFGSLAVRPSEWHGTHCCLQFCLRLQRDTSEAAVQNLTRNERILVGSFCLGVLADQPREATVSQTAGLRRPSLPTPSPWTPQPQRHVRATANRRGLRAHSQLRRQHAWRASRGPSQASRHARA